MQYQVIHTTEYEYHHAVSLCHNTMKLMIRDTEDQHCKKVTIRITPEPDVVNEYEDYFGNKVMYFAVQHEHKLLKVSVHSLVEKIPGPNAALNLYTHSSWEDARMQILDPGPENFDARQYIAETEITAVTDDIRQYATLSFTGGRSLFEATNDLMQRIFRDFEFKSGFTTVSTPLNEVMKSRKGVCQDFAHLAIACVRSVGLAARYISGYIETLPPYGKEKLTGVDASHAWFAVYFPHNGWLAFDPTNNMIPGEQHLIIGWGRDYADIAPLKGVILSSGQHHLKVSVDVRRIG